MSHRAVYKTKLAEFLDDFYSGESRSREEAFDDATALMARSGPLSDTTRDLEGRDTGAVEEGTADAFDNGWLSSSAKHADDPIERVLRLGYQEAVNIARDRGVAIDNFWVTGAGDDFELHICEAADRVTVFMFVPNEGVRPYGSTRAASRSWVVRAGDIPEVRQDSPRSALDGELPPTMRIQVSGDLGGQI